MIDVTELWLPILVSAVLLFLASSVIHMLTPWHAGDYRRLPDEDGVMAALRPFDLPPGDYTLPRPGSIKELGSPAYIERATRGPRVIMTVLPGGPPAMGKNLAGWFVYLLVMTTLLAGLTALVMPRGAPAHDVFHVVLIAGSLAYAAALWPITIWYSRSLGTTLRSSVDGIVYAAITAGVLANFWPT